MFTVKLEVNGRVIERIDAVRQSDRAYGDNTYNVYNGIKPTYRGGPSLIGTVSHVFEDGASVLAIKLIEFLKNK